MSSISYHTFLKDFKTTKVLGKGNCSVVNEVVHMAEMKNYALKIIELKNCEDLGLAFHQVETMKTMEHPAVVKIFYYYVREHPIKHKMEFGIIMEKCHGTLSAEIMGRKVRRQYYTLAQATKFLETLVNLFASMQRKKYLHRDIKPDNILISNEDSESCYKLADFGFSVRMSIYSKHNIAGTMEYVSPKLVPKFKDSKAIVPGNNHKDDVYSLGRTFLEMLMLEKNVNYINKQVQKQIEERYGAEISSILRSMLTVEEHDRPSFSVLQARLKASKKPKCNPEGDNLLNSLNNSVQNISLVNLIEQADKTAGKMEDKMADKMTDKMTDKMIEKTAVKENPIDEVNSQKQDQLKTRKKELKKPCDRKEAVANIATFNFKGGIFSLVDANGLLVLGMEGKVGVVVGSDQIWNIIIPHNRKPITGLKVDKSRKYLWMVSIDGFIRRLKIQDIVSHITKLKSKEIKDENGFNALNIQIAAFDVLEIKTGAGINCFDLNYKEGEREPRVVVGHHNGTIQTHDGDTTYIDSSSVMKIVSNETYVYAASSQGLFKKLPVKAVWKDEQVNNPVKQNLFKLDFFHADSAIIDFRLIPEKKWAALCTIKGYSFFLNEAMECLKMVKVSETPLLAALLEEDHNLIFDKNGKLLNLEGECLCETEIKGINCATMMTNYIICGSYTGTIGMLEF